tara:strand:- start:339 stop:560 length:222 start_codon:yes stop_codon:yes gene_type:complete
MGNLNSKINDNDKLLSVNLIEINIGESIGEYVQMLVGDMPSGFLKQDTEKIPENVNEEEYNETLANAYLYGII